MENRSLGDRIARARREARSRSRDGIEQRTVRAVVELRESEGTAPEFHGHAAVFNDLSEDLGFFEPWYERIDPAAFDSVLRRNPDVRALINHDPNLPLARSTIAEGAGSLSLDADDVGLAYRFVATPTTYADDLRENVKAGVVNQSSFAFRIARKGDSWEEDDEGRLVRTIHQFSELYDVSPVTYPAYPTTDVDVSSRDGECVACRAFNETPSPEAERNDDEAASQRVDDGGTEEADGANEGLTVEQTKQRLRLRGARLRA